MVPLPETKAPDSHINAQYIELKLDGGHDDVFLEGHYFAASAIAEGQTCAVYSASAISVS